MDRNFLLAFIISTIAIFVYYTLFPPPENTQTDKSQTPSQIVEKVETSKEISGPVSEAAVQPQPVQVENAQRKTITVENRFYAIEIDSQDGAVKSFFLKNHKHALEPHFDIVDWGKSLFTGKKKELQPYDPNLLVNMVGDLSAENRVWKIDTGTEGTPVNYHASREMISVRGTPEKLTLQGVTSLGLEIYKTLVFNPDSYQIEMEVKVLNRTRAAQKISPRINFGAGSVSIDREAMPRPKVGMSYIEEDFDTYDEGDFEEGVKIENPLWVGIMDTYFLTAIRTTDESTFRGEMTPLDSVLNQNEIKVPKLTYLDQPRVLEKNQVYQRSFQLFVGPKIQSELEKFDLSLPAAMDLGWFDFLAHPLLSVLRWIQGYVVNWGVAIILLTIIVRSVMFPLAFKGMMSMRKMSALNPKIKQIREKNKGNKEKMNKEIMQFYSQHKINPMGGCLPMVLQIPVFIGLYQALMPAIELRHNPFIFWMQDLSAPDFTLILPILMGASMFFQQSLSPTPAMDPTQQKLMKWMPVMMVMFFLSMPSGLVLYWVISNLISVLQQLFFNRVSPVVVEEVPVKGKGKGKGKTKGKSK
ncbi:MAG: membrane protein insertase YidC [Deltaproteobacteria bacterium]|nr:membrane protein insertase YidC [Deltaproteobacteria bacterium]